MTDRTIDARAHKLHVLTQQIENLEKVAEVLRQQLKAELESRNVEEVKTIGGLTIRWQTINGTRFDGSSFKAAEPELYRQYLKTTCSRRFTLSA